MIFRRKSWALRHVVHLFSYLTDLHAASVNLNKTGDNLMIKFPERMCWGQISRRKQREHKAAWERNITMSLRQHHAKISASSGKRQGFQICALFVHQLKITKKLLIMSQMIKSQTEMSY